MLVGILGISRHRPALLSVTPVFRGFLHFYTAVTS